MSKLETCCLAVVSIAFSACGPAPEGVEPAGSGTGVTQTELTTRRIPNTTCLVEATGPYSYGDGTMSAQASVYDCSTSYPIIYVCSMLEKRSVSSSGTVTWTPVEGSRNCYPEKNLDFGGQTANRTVYTSGGYRQRAQAAIKLNATTWTPAQPSGCTTLANDIPCVFTSTVSVGVSM